MDHTHHHCPFTANLISNQKRPAKHRKTTPLTVPNQESISTTPPTPNSTQISFVSSMEDLRSKSFSDGRLDMEVYGNRAAAPPGLPPDFRSYSTPHSQASHGLPSKGKPASGSSSSSGSALSKGVWCLSDPELQRKKRVAGYKAYAVEGKVKGSLRKSLRWFKERYTQVLNGWR